MRSRKSTRGGVREGAGRPSVYPEKSRKAFAMAFTVEGRARLEKIRTRTQLGRNDIVEHLLRVHGRALHTIATWSPKVFPPVAIRLTPDTGERLLAIQERTDASQTDIGETLVRRFGHRTTFPVLEERHSDKRPKGRRRSTGRPRRRT